MTVAVSRFKAKITMRPAKKDIAPSVQEKVRRKVMHKHYRNLSLFIKKNNYTINEFSRLVGVKSSSMKNYLNCGTEMGAKTAYKICKFTGMSIKQLMEGEI